MNVIDYNITFLDGYDGLRFVLHYDFKSMWYGFMMDEFSKKVEFHKISQESLFEMVHMYDVDIAVLDST